METKINIKSVIIDIVILWILVLIGGFILGFIPSMMSGSPIMPSRGISLLVSMLMLTLGFCISGYRNSIILWKHLIIVAICFWLTDSGVRIIMSGLSIRLFLLLICILITMGIGGAISIIFVEKYKGNKMERNEVVEQINKLLDNFAGLGIESLSQEPYRGNCKKIFIEAPKDLTADELKDSVQALFDSNSTKYDLKLKLLEQLHNMWYEWNYIR